MRPNPVRPTLPDDHVHTWNLRHGFELIEVMPRGRANSAFFLSDGSDRGGVFLGEDSVVVLYRNLKQVSDEIFDALRTWIEERFEQFEAEGAQNARA